MLRISSFLFIALVFLCMNEADAATNKEEFELQKECSKEGETFFNKNWPSMEAGWTRNYRAHYNPNLNKFFIEVIEAEIPNSKDDHGSFMSYSITNVFSRKEMVNISFYRAAGKKYWESKIYDCMGKVAPCQSTKEFQTFASEFMGDDLMDMGVAYEDLKLEQ